ncbi:hypothetical protein D3C78_811130 [compost metagenome]
MRRRLFERLEQGIERVRGKHVHFVDQVDLVAAAARGVLHVIQQLAGVLDLGTARRIHLDQIDEAPLVDLPAHRALTTWCRADAGLAVQALGQDARNGSLADPAGAGEQVGVVQTLVVQRIDQGLEHMGLADHFTERARTPLAGKNLITHRICSLRLLAWGVMLAKHGANCTRRGESPGAQASRRNRLLQSNWKMGLQKWRWPRQPHLGTRRHRYGCFLPDLTRLTANRCEGTDRATITYSPCDEPRHCSGLHASYNPQAKKQRQTVAPQQRLHSANSTPRTLHISS